MDGVSPKLQFRLVKPEINQRKGLTCWLSKYRSNFAKGLALDNQFADNC